VQGSLAADPSFVAIRTRSCSGVLREGNLVFNRKLLIDTLILRFLFLSLCDFGQAVLRFTLIMALACRFLQQDELILD